jgi:hypothetical protein
MGDADLFINGSRDVEVIGDETQDEAPEHDV